LFQTITRTINAACGLGGAIMNLIEIRIRQECLEGGAVSNAIRIQIDDMFDAIDARSEARYLNSLTRDALSIVRAIPNRNRVFPAYFPATLQEFFDLNAPAVMDLLIFYELPINGDAMLRKKRLANFCNILSVI